MNHKIISYIFTVVLFFCNSSIVASITFKNKINQSIEVYAVRGQTTLSAITSRFETLFGEETQPVKTQCRKLLTLKGNTAFLVDHDKLIKWGIEDKFSQNAFDTLAIVIKNTGTSKSNYDVLRISKTTLVELDKSINSSISILQNTAKQANNYSAIVSFDSSTGEMSQFNDGKSL